MDYFYAVILGLLEGLTEFIPVSSTGHLLLATRLLGLTTPQWESFVILIQLGAILAVVVVYFQRLWNVLITLPTDPRSRRFALSIIVAFIPAVVLGTLFYKFIKQVLFNSPGVICASLLIGGIVLLALDRFARTPRYTDAYDVPLGRSFGVGLMQTLAMIPGVSRSGSTIAGGLVLGLDKQAAAEFSFFLAIPTMAAAFAKDALENKDALLHGHFLPVIAVGFVVSFISGLIVVRSLLAFVARHGFAPFAWWRIAIGAGGLVFLALQH
ncbi:undecaprenyl-diphosphate phosphatase [soil metagenome]